MEKKRRDFLVETCEAIYCKCGKFVEKPEHNVCYHCWGKIQTEKRRRNIENKLKGAEITNLVFKYDEDMTEIIVNKNGVSFRLEIHGYEEERAYIRLEDEWSEPCPLILHRLGDLPRVERKLETFNDIVIS